MLQQLPKWWRLVCLAHCIIAIIFGASYLFFPDVIVPMLGWAIIDPFVDRMLGGALLAMAWAHFLSSKETTAEKIIIPIQLYFIFDVFGTILSLWSALSYSFLAGWMLVVIFGVFMVTYAMVIFKK